MSLRSRSTAENNSAERKETGKHLLIISFAALFVFVAMQVTQAQKKKPEELRSSMAVTGDDVQSLDAKLQGFERQLPGQELGAIHILLWRAANAPLDDPAGTDLKRSFFDLGSPIQKAGGGGIYMVAQAPATGSAPRKKIGGAESQPPAGGSTGRNVDEPNRPPPPQPRLEVLSAALGVGDASIGRDGPKPPPPETISALESKLVGFGNQLSPRERGIMNWLLQRGASSEARQAAAETGPHIGSPGGRPPALAQALGIAAFGSRPGASSPNGWVLRY